MGEIKTVLGEVRAKARGSAADNTAGISSFDDVQALEGSIEALKALDLKLGGSLDGLVTRLQGLEHKTMAGAYAAANLKTAGFEPTNANIEELRAAGGVIPTG